MLNVAHHGWLSKKIFHSRSPKTTSNDIFLPFYLNEKTFIKKNCIKKLEKNHLKISLIIYVELHIYTEKDHLCFYKNSGNQTFTFISSKLVYFSKHVTSIAPLGNKFSTAIKCSVMVPDNYTCSRSNDRATPKLD